MARITVPIALIIYKRTGTLRQLVDKLNQHDISRLYIIADGPKNSEEKTETDRARSIAEETKAEKIHKVYSQLNLGLRLNLTKGITKAFRDTEQLIVLEDDCMPSKAFLESCETLQNDLTLDSTLAGFCGSSFLPNVFSQRLWRSSKFNVWGWMVSKHCWTKFIDSGFLALDSEELMAHRSSLSKLPPLAKWEMMRIIKVLDEIDTWDVQFETFCVANGFDFLKPQQNLVRNVGFDEVATHTGKFGSSLSIAAEGSAITQTGVPATKSQILEWLEHSSKLARLLGEFLESKLFSRRG